MCRPVFSSCRLATSCCGTHWHVPSGLASTGSSPARAADRPAWHQRGSPARPHLRLLFQSSSLNETSSGLFHLFLRLVHNHVIRIGGK